MLKMRIGIGLFCKHLAENNVEMIDVFDYDDYIKEDAWSQPPKSVDEIISRISDFDMVTLICRDNNYEPPAKQWVKLVCSNGWPDFVADHSYVPTNSESKPKTDTHNPEAMEDAMSFLQDEELLWEFVHEELNRRSSELNI